MPLGNICQEQLINLFTCCYKVNILLCCSILCYYVTNLITTATLVKQPTVKLLEVTFNSLKLY